MNFLSAVGTHSYLNHPKVLSLIHKHNYTRRDIQNSLIDSTKKGLFLRKSFHQQLVEIAILDQREWKLDLLTPGNPTKFAFGMIDPFLQAFNGLKKRETHIYEAKKTFCIKPKEELKKLPVVNEVRWTSNYLRNLRQIKRGPHYYFKANITGIYTLSRAIPFYSEFGSLSALYDELAIGLIQIVQCMKEIAPTNMSHIQIDEPALGRLPFYDMTKNIVYKDLIPNILPALREFLRAMEEPMTKKGEGLATCIHCDGLLDVEIANLLLEAAPYQIGVNCVDSQGKPMNTDILSYMHKKGHQSSIGVGMFPTIVSEKTFWNISAMKALFKTITQIYPVFVYIQSNSALYNLPYPKTKSRYEALRQLFPEKSKKRNRSRN
ncbi:MAG: hypothetical protein ACFFC7_25930 [Candidatus Hermodarchaeota archaeon]